MVLNHDCLAPASWQRRKTKSYKIFCGFVIFCSFSEHRLKIPCDTWLNKLLYSVKSQRTTVSCTNRVRVRVVSVSSRFWVTCCTRRQMRETHTHTHTQKLHTFTVTGISIQTNNPKWPLSSLWGVKVPALTHILRLYTATADNTKYKS